MKIKFKDFINESVPDDLLYNRFGIQQPHADFEKKYNKQQSIENKEDIIYNKGNLTIIKNPKNLNTIGENIRGIIDKDGNLYISQINKEILHNDILKILYDLNLVKNIGEWYGIIPTEFITVIRYKKTNIFLLGESNAIMYPPESRNNGSNVWKTMPSREEVKPIFQQFLNKVKEKNTNIKFVNELERFYQDNVSENIMKTYQQFIFEKCVEKKDIIKLLDFPNIRQSTSWSCGAAALETVLTYYGIDVKETELMKELGTTEKDGTNPKNIIKYCHKIGLKTEQKDNMSIDDLIEYIDDDIPVILEIQAWKDSKKKYENDWSDGHYTVVVGYTKNEIIFSDPVSFNLTYLSYSDLMKRWHDIDNSKKNIQYGIAIYGKKPKFNKNEIKKEE